MSTNANMELWDQVCQTDPAQTKRVNQRGGFTAIGAQYQIREATKVWGPYGTTWGVRECRYTEIRDERASAYKASLPVPTGKAPPYCGEVQEVALDAMFWYPGGEFEISTDIAYQPGNDTRKKLLTDLTTKALSKLGFNADVFMGLFDDNKYVNGRRQAMDKPPEGTTTADKLPDPPKPKGNGEQSKGPATAEDSMTWLMWVYEGLSKDGELEGKVVDHALKLRQRVRDGWPGDTTYSLTDQNMIVNRAKEVLEMYDKRTAAAATE